MKTPSSSDLSRRDFVKLSAATTGAAALARLAGTRMLGATTGSDRIRVGVVGCGARGSGAAVHCVEAAPGVEIVALADLFPRQVEAARVKFSPGTDDTRVVRVDGAGAENRRVKGAKEKFKVTPDRCFTGFDAYRKLLATDIDLVILATPPGFRPMHFAAAIEAGKHVFMEKPIAVDPVGCRAVIETAKRAREKNLAVVAGTMHRHDFGYIETIKRIQGGDIGELVGGQCYWNWGRDIWFREKKDWAAALTDFEWQCWNWYHWDWLSGDHIVEQHIHNIDVINWAFGAPPVKFYGVGGRQTRGSLPGNIWDHFAVEMEYANGARVMSMCRQANKVTERTGERVVGTKGVSDCNTMIAGGKPFTYDGPRPEPLVQEHADLIASIRKGSPLNEGERVALSTLTAIGGRISAYTGRKISWNWLMNASQLDIFPKAIGPGPGIFPPIAMPGTTPLV